MSIFNVDTYSMLENLVQNVDDIDLLQQLVNKNEAVITMANEIFSKEMEERCLYKEISKDDLSIYVKAIITMNNLDDEKVNTTLKLLIDSCMDENINKKQLEEILAYKILEVKEPESIKKVDYNSSNIKPKQKPKPLIVPKENEYSIEELKELDEVKKYRGQQYYDNVINVKKQIFNIIRKSIKNNQELRDKALARANSIYNLDILRNLLDTLNNENLINNRTEEELYTLVSAFTTTNTDYYSDLMYEIFNDELISKRRTFSEKVDMAFGVYKNKHLGKYILLNKNIIESRTNEEALKLYEEVINSKTYKHFNILLGLINSSNWNKFSFEEEMKEIEVVKKSRNITEMSTIANLYSSLLYFDDIPFEDMLNYGITVLGFKDNMKGEYFSKLAVVAANNNNLDATDLKEFLEDIANNDNYLEVKAKYNILVKSSINIEKDDLTDLCNIKIESTNPFIQEEQKLLSLIKNIKNSENINELRNETVKVKKI